MPHLASCTSLAAAERARALLDASRVAVDNLVQATQNRCREAGAQTFLWGTKEENKESAPVFTKTVTIFPTTLFNLFSVLKSRCVSGELFQYHPTPGILVP